MADDRKMSQKTVLRNSLNMREHATAEEVSDMLSRFKSPSSDQFDDMKVNNYRFVFLSSLSDLLYDALFDCFLLKCVLFIGLNDIEISFIHTI
jgi:hypothetical protein